MFRTVTRIATAATLAAITATATAAPASAQEPPVVERVPIEVTFPDEFLTEVCGVPVTTTVTGSVRTITFSGEGTGLREVTTLNLKLIASADGNTFRFRDLGADLVRVEPDGTAILMIIGQIPFSFTGVMKIDLETGEVILEPQHSTEDELAEACAVLTS
jgi:hypothetical protein